MPKTSFLRLKMLLWIGLLTQFAFTQNSDFFRLEYAHNPYNASEAEFSRFKASFNVPFKLKNGDYFITGMEYQHYNFTFDDDVTFPTENIDRLHVLDLNLSYTTKWNENWRLVLLFAPRIASTWTGSLESDDFQLNGTAYIVKNRPNLEKPYRLILGIGINSSAGVPIPLPTINYWKQFHPKWSYSLGIPKFNLKHQFTPKHSAQVFMQLDGFFVNIQDRFNAPNGKRAESISYRAIVGGLGYEYKFNKYLSYYLYGGYTLNQNTIFRDNDRDKILTIDDNRNFYLRTGIKFGL